MIKTKRGGGPKSPQGKLTCSTNAIKKGVYTERVILPGESERDFDELLEQFNRDFSPNDVAESMMVRELAVLTWKKLRLERLEYSFYKDVLNEPVLDLELNIRNIPPNEGCKWLLKDLSIVTPEFVEDHKQLKLVLISLSNSKSLENDFLNLPKNHPKVFQEFVNLAHDNFVIENHFAVTPQFLTKLNISHHGKNSKFIEFALIQLDAKVEQVLWANHYLNPLKETVTAVQGRRLLAEIRRDGALRASDDLSRAFFRTLSELRRQQKFRKDMGIIDVSNITNED